MISIELAELVHAKSIDRFGGGKGLRDKGALEAALARPFQTFGGEDLFPTTAGKAAALMEGIIIRHPWMDGNKRTGLALTLFFLARQGLKLSATQNEIYEMTIRVAEGKSNTEELQTWIEAHTVPWA
jgi:death-on-curing protein